MRPLEFISDQAFSGIFFRRQYAELTGAGGLWDKSKKMYPEFKAKMNISNLRWDFPSGSQIRMSHMHTEESKESHRGLQYSFIGFDEIDQFTLEQVTFLLTCLRSEADMDSFCIGTCNPSPTAWTYDLVKWYLDLETGLPDPAKIGAVRYYIILDGAFVFGDTPEYFDINYPDAVNVYNPLTKENIYIPPKTFCFLAGNIFDNPALIEANPRYLSELQNLPDHERDRQLWGNWHSIASGSSVCEPRKWIIDAPRVPENSFSVRGYDLASTEPNDNNRFPDATTSIRYWKSPDGYYYLTGDYHHDFKDDVDNNIIGGRLRKRVGERNQIMLRQAELDGDDTIVIIPIDPSAAGVAVFEDLAKQFASRGYRCKRDPSPTTKSKVNKFLPFADACQNGLVHIVRDTFPNDETIEFIYRELEKFTGERSTRHRKDDFPDCIASAHNAVNKAIAPSKPVALPDQRAPTILSAHRNRISHGQRSR